MDAEDKSDYRAIEAGDQVAGSRGKLKGSDFPGFRCDATLELPNREDR